MEQPVVINSLLCFIHNFRDQPDIRELVEKSFSFSAVIEARKLLIEKLNKETNPSIEDLLELYDECSLSCNVQFAATDLRCLPISTSHRGGDDENSQILREIRELRSYLADTLEGKMEDGSRDTSTPAARCKLNTSASSPEFTDVSPQPTKRKAARSLDAAVKKLSEKFKAETEETSPVETPTSTPAWQPSVDPQAYLNMIRMMQSGSQGLIGNVLGTIQNLTQQPLSSEDGEKDDEDDGSPSPSEENKDDAPLLEMSIDNDSDKPFICEHFNCQKRFANKFLLKKHQFIHTGLRPHTCPYCSKRFNRKDNLLRHKKTHIQSGIEDVGRRVGLPEAICGLFPGISNPLLTLQDMKNEQEHEGVLA